MKPPPTKSRSKWMATVTNDFRFRSLIHLRYQVIFGRYFLVRLWRWWYPKHPQESKLQCWMSNGRNRFQSSHLPPIWEPLSIIVFGKEFAMGFHDFNELASSLPITCVSSQGTIWGFCLCHSASCELRDLGNVCVQHILGDGSIKRYSGLVYYPPCSKSRFQSSFLSHGQNPSQTLKPRCFF